MEVTFETAGLNTERLLTLAAEAGIVIKGIERLDERTIRLRIPVYEKAAYLELSERYGWETRAVSQSLLLSVISWVRRRPAILGGLAAYLLLMALSSGAIWQIHVEGAGKSEGEIRRYLIQERIVPGRRIRAVSPSALRDQLMLRLPDLAHITVGYEGSRLVIECQQALEGEQTRIQGGSLDLVASQDGMITGIVVTSGTPAVSIGQAVCAGDVLIRGVERAENQSARAVIAQGTVTARVWSRAEAKVARFKKRTVETGALRRRITVKSPWHQSVICDAPSFERQDVSVEIQKIVGLYLPLTREIETLAEIEVIQEERPMADALSMAQGAAEQMAKNKCPPGVHILDKSVENSMIDDEYVYAAVVLEYEDSIAVRQDQAYMIHQ